MSSSDAASSGRDTGRRTLWMGGVVAVGLALLVLAAVVYAQRESIARRLAEDWLARQHVPGDVKVRALSLTGLTAAVRIGDPGHPALTVERMDVAYAVNWPWQAGGFGVRTRSVRLIRPRLTLALTPAGVDLGPLKPLMDWVKSLPPGPMPDIEIENGVASFSGPGGYLGFAGSAQTRGGALASADGRVAPFRIAMHGLTAAGSGGALHAGNFAGQIETRLELGPISGAAGSGEVHAQALSVRALTPSPTANGALNGHATLSADVRGFSLQSGRLDATGAISGRLDGEVKSDPARTGFLGGASLSLTAGRVGAGWARLTDLAADMTLAQLSLAMDRAGARASGQGLIDLGARIVASQGVGAVAIRRGQVSGLVSLPANGAPQFKLAMAGGVSGSGSTAPRMVSQVAAGLSAAPDISAATARALAAVSFAADTVRLEAGSGGAGLTLASPLRVLARSGARLTLSPLAGVIAVGPNGLSGDARLIVAGGGLPSVVADATRMTATPNHFAAGLHVVGDADTPQLKKAHVDAAGELTSDVRGLRFVLAGCAPISAQSVGPAENPTTGLAVRICPDGRPALTASTAGWTAHARIEGAGGRSADAEVADGEGTLSASGEATGGAVADLSLARAAVVDKAKPVRFMPLGLAGHAHLRNGALTGVFLATAAGGRPLATLRLANDLVHNAGDVEIDTPELAFTPNRFQPTDITPLAASLTSAKGPVRFHARFAWRGGTQASGGTLSVKDFSMATPLGPASGVTGDVAFASLNPLATAPGQVIRIARIDAVTPLSGVEVRFDLNSKRLAIDAASAGFAKGRLRLEPMTLPLAAGAATHGVLDFEAIDMGQILAATNLDQQIKLDAVVSGALPFDATADSLSIRGGHLAAIKPGRLSISRQALGAPPAGASPPAAGKGAAAADKAARARAAQAQAAQDLAYQALENLAFDQLDARLDTRPDDRLSILFHISGRHAPPTPARATIAIGDLIRGQALAKPLPLPSGTKISLTLDTSLNFADLIRQLKEDWSRARAPSPAVQKQSASMPAH